MGCRCSRAKNVEPEDTVSTDTVVDLTNRTIQSGRDVNSIQPVNDPPPYPPPSYPPPSYTRHDQNAFPIVGKTKEDMPEYPIVKPQVHCETIPFVDIRDSNWGQMNPHMRFSQPVSLRGIQPFMGGSTTRLGDNTYERQPVPATEPSLKFQRDLAKFIFK